MRWLLLWTALGAWLRFQGLDRPLWTDEALFGFMVKDGAYQEYLAVWLTWIWFDGSEVSLRILFALCGTLTIPAVWYVTRDNWATALVAVFPLFVFWSGMARPYAFVGLFVVLSWRWWWLIIPAVLTTPIALVGYDFTQWRKLIWLVPFGVIMFLLRPDADRGWTLENIWYHTRWFYVPALAVILWCSRYVHARTSSAGQMVFKGGGIV